MLLFLLSLFLVALNFSCDSSGTNPPPTPDYRIEGAVIIDPNLEAASNSLRTVVRFEREGKIVATGDIRFGASQLILQPGFGGLDSVYAFSDDSTYQYTNSTQSLVLKDGSTSAGDANFVVADSFSILSVVPANHLILGNGQASLDWDGATNADAYFLAAVLVDSAYSGWGYSINTSLATQGTIPPEAFTLTDGLNPDTGLYNLYVYAVTGNPDSAIASALLPVPLPISYGDNIAERNLAGRFGSVVVTLLDTVRVAQQTQ